MIAALRLVVGLPRIAFHLALGMAIIAFLFPMVEPARRDALKRWWSRRVLTIAGVRIRVIGPRTADPERARIVREAFAPSDPVKATGAMLVLNHISWLDIHVIDAIRPARFVAKSEIAGWPVVGYLTSRTGTIFIERGRRHAVRDANHRAAQLLAEGALIGMFPEGTTGDGDRLLPFHANLIQPAIEARVPVIVAGLRYVDRDGRRTVETSYIGDTSLFESVVRILRAPPIVAELHLIDAIDGASATRHEVSRRARALIADALDFDDEADEAAEGVSTVIVVPDAGVRTGAATAGRAPEAEIDLRDELL